MSQLLVKRLPASKLVHKSSLAIVSSPSIHCPRAYRPAGATDQRIHSRYRNRSLQQCNAAPQDKDATDSKPPARDVSVHSLSEGAVMKQSGQVLGDEVGAPVPVGPLASYQNTEAETFVTNQGVVEPVASDDEAEALQSLMRRVQLLSNIVHSPLVSVPQVASDSTRPSPSMFDFLGESTEGDLHIVQRMRSAGMINVLGLQRVSDILEVPTAKLQSVTQMLLDAMEVPTGFPAGDPQRAIYCSRTLNVRSIKAIGYDMDYTLIHYDVNAWEGRAYEYGMESLREQGCPVEGLEFDSNLVIRGLIMDKELGNLIKVDRFGLVKRAMHGTRMLTWNEIRDAYGREVVNLRNEGRWVFLNTLFSVSEAVIYGQLVDRLDQGMFDAPLANITYQQLYKMVAKALYRTHVEGKLKAEIIKEPEKYVELDPEMAATLLDQKDSGKLLLLVTNSDYEYTDQMMTFAYNRFLPNGMKWRDLFDMVVVMARKPDFFNYNMSLYEVVTEDGLMRPALAAKRGGLYCGGSARMVESALGIEGDDILYVGDHIYTDAALAKINFRWRTALIIRELEAEVNALEKGRPHRERLLELMTKKEVIGDLFNQLRLARQRALTGRGGVAGSGFQDEEAVNETLAQLLVLMEHLDQQLGPMLSKDGSDFNERWGYLSRAGLNDKSQLCRQIEKYADIYTSRVANFLRYSPYQYFRTPSQSLAHDRNWSRRNGNGAQPPPLNSSSSRFLSYNTFLHDHV